jgi:hypothetical protein
LFSDLPNLFGRDFAIGFLLPVALLIPFSFLVADGFGNASIHAHLEGVQNLQDKPILLGATIFVFVLWFGAVTLLALNRTIIRLKEGYGRWNPARVWSFFEKRRFKSLQKRLRDLDHEVLLAKSHSLMEDLASLRPRRNDIAIELAESFPDQERYLLPTAFGNTIRAFEVYSRVMYGLDAIPLWPRLLMIMSEDVRALVDAAKAEMDFWLNLWVMGLVLLAEYLALAVSTQNRGNLSLLLFVFILIPLSSNRARGAAAGWGEMVKAAFDVHLSALRDKFEMQEQGNRDTERQYWDKLSAALTYRRQEYLPPRKKRTAGRKEGRE